jgi:hypothetical protein
MPYRTGYFPSYGNRNTLLVLYYEATGGYSLVDYSSATGPYVMVANTQTGPPLAQLLQEIQCSEVVPPTVTVFNRDSPRGYAGYHRLTWERNRQYLRPACPCPVCQQGQARLTPP